jgi:hypothetical protein
MPARRSTSAGAESPCWRRAHRALFSECGIPDAVADSDRRWVYILLHGDDYPGTGWDASLIPPDQAERLLDSLLADLQGESHYDLIRCLRRRVSEPDA